MSDETRRYSLNEIDQMRRAVRDRHAHWTFYDDGGASMRPPPDNFVEERLRTYMIGGVSLEELRTELANVIESARKRPQPRDILGFLRRKGLLRPHPNADEMDAVFRESGKGD